MNKTPGGPGASVHCGGEPDPSNATRVRIQANRRMAVRLESLKWGLWWSPGFNARHPSVETALHTMQESANG